MLNYQVIWRGHASHAGGWGTACREYALALNKLGVDVKIDASNNHLPETDKTKIKKLKSLISKPLAQSKKKVLVYHYHPYNIDLKKERTKFDYIILNTAWETTKIPDNWMPAINDFDAVFVPSRQNIEAMKESGVRVPLFLIPHGAETGIFTPDNKSARHRKSRFTFLSVFDFQHRKNPEGLLRAYWEEFKPAENVKLIVKTYWSGNKRLENVIEQIISKYKIQIGFGGQQTAPLCLITRTIEQEKLKRLYNNADVFVLPTRGEGFGLPFIEALSSGIPVIATGWGGQMDFLNDGNAFLVDYKLESPSKHMKSAISRKFQYLFGQPGQLWAEPNILSLRKQMRSAYENPVLCKQKGRQGREDMLKMTWEKAGQILKQAIEEVID